jgi:dephospho-CoA kinase
MKELTDTFGQGIENPDGSLNRPKLSEIVFSEHPPVPDALHRLNTITHRYVKETFSDWCTEQGRSGYSVVLIDAPLLFEAGIDRDCAVTIAVDCPTETRVKRIMKRDGITREAALRRIRAQISGEELCRKCDYSIENTGTLEETKKQLAVLLQNLYKRGILS